MKIERRKEGGGRLYLSVRKDDVEEVEAALIALQEASRESAPQIIVRLVRDAAKNVQRRNVPRAADRERQDE